MLLILILLGWIVALACIVYLATHAIGRRLVGRNRRKLFVRRVREFKRHHSFDEKRQQWVRKLDGVAVVDEASEDRRMMLVLLGWLLLVMWEVYWIFEIIERVSGNSKPLQLPYFFLFVVLVVIPLAVNMVFRRRMRRSARSLDMLRNL